MSSSLAFHTFSVLAMENPFSKFGVTSWEPFIANAIAFVVAAVILWIFALGPIRKMLDERKQRIIEGEEMRAKSEQMLNDIEQRSRHIIDKAQDESTHIINEAREAAAKLLEQRKEDAAKMVEDILAKSREAAALESQQAREELRNEFTRLIALTTAQVTGKVLTDSDKHAIDQSALDAIK